MWKDLESMGVRIVLGDTQSHMVVRVQGTRDDPAVLSCLVTKDRSNIGLMKMALLVFKVVCRDAPERGGRQVHLEGPGNVVSLGL